MSDDAAKRRDDAIIAALHRVAREGEVSISLSENRLSFEWPADNHDAVFVFEALTARRP